MPLTSRVRKVCQACGTKLAVVKMAATEPTQSMRFMVCGYVGWFEGKCREMLSWLAKNREKLKQ
jgi:uncharacterized protein with PIN domain